MNTKIFPRIAKRTKEVFFKPRKNERVITHALYEELLSGIEKLRSASGVVCAASSPEYTACWLRDQLYATLAYFYLGNHKKFREGVWVAFDIFHTHKEKLESVICYPPAVPHEYLHAKFNPITFEEITKEWGHHQLDAIGLFLFAVSFAHEKGIKLIRDKADEEILQLLVLYLSAVRFWEIPDNGMWEEGIDFHASSIGACVSGLTKIKEAGLAVVPASLIAHGSEMLFKLLPNESPTREEDLAQLSLIWPYNVMPSEVKNVVLKRIVKKLVQERGVNRYWGDNYYRSASGVSAEWTMGFFWLSIAYAEAGDKKNAYAWFLRGLATRTESGDLPELYFNGKPNGNTPLAWSHSLAIIAAKKLEGLYA